MTILKAITTSPTKTTYTLQVPVPNNSVIKSRQKSLSHVVSRPNPLSVSAINLKTCSRYLSFSSPRILSIPGCETAHLITVILQLSLKSLFFSDS